MTIRLYNTLSRDKQVFEPLDPNRVTMYVCGPTVYNYAHIGNARPAVIFDLLFRLLKLHYPQVVYARNITDVDDKINETAAELGVPISEISSKYADAYHQDMAALGRGPAHHRTSRHRPYQADDRHDPAPDRSRSCLCNRRSRAVRYRVV